MSFKSAAIVIDTTNGLDPINKAFLVAGFDDSNPLLTYHKMSVSTTQVVFVLLFTIANVSNEEQKIFDQVEKDNCSLIHKNEVMMAIRIRMQNEWTERFCQRIREVVYFSKENKIINEEN